MKPEASELVGHVCTLLSLVEGTLDFLGKLEYGPGTPVEWQWLPTENFSNPGEKILKFGVPLERPGEFLVDLDQHTRGSDPSRTSCPSGLPNPKVSGMMVAIPT